MRIRTLILCTCLATPALANASESMAPAADTETATPDAWVPVDPARLAEMRGGMQLPSGLSLSFGIERAVYVNGELIASSRLQVADLSRITPEQAAALSAVADGMVVQIGAGNHVLPGTGQGLLLIQNSLDGQDIRASTRLDVGVDTLGRLQQMNTFDALHGALIATPGGP